MVHTVWIILHHLNPSSLIRRPLFFVFSSSFWIKEAKLILCSLQTNFFVPKIQNSTDENFGKIWKIKKHFQTNHHWIELSRCYEISWMKSFLFPGDFKCKPLVIKWWASRTFVLFFVSVRNTKWVEINYFFKQKSFLNIFIIVKYFNVKIL